MVGFWSTLWSIVYICIFVGTIIVLLTEERDVSEKIAWILVIAFLPVIGLILYLLLGMNYRGNPYRLRNHKRFNEAVQSFDLEWLNSKLSASAPEDGVKDEYVPLIKLLRQAPCLGALNGEDVEIFTDGQIKLESLMEDIQNAKKYIHMEYFYFRKGAMGTKFKELLKEKAREGVKVRFIRENIANFDIPAHYYNEMKKAGVEVIRFTPVLKSLLVLPTKLNFRDHRKIVVIDGEIAYTGGMNISDSYYSDWRDTHLKFKGDAVAPLQLSFLDTFISSGGVIDTQIDDLFPMAFKPETEKHKEAALQPVPGDPESPWPILSMGLEWVLHNAKEYVWIQTPYFLPPEPLFEALKAAALKGIDIRLMLPAKTDIFLTTLANRSYYRECLAAGIKIYINNGKFIHSKTMVSDDYLSIIGSANLDARSLELSYEMNTFIYDVELASKNKAIFLKDMELCSELTMEEWSRTHVLKKFLYSLCRFLSPIL